MCEPSSPMARGAYVEHKTTQGNTALSVATERANVLMVNYLESLSGGSGSAKKKKNKRKKK